MSLHGYDCLTQIVTDRAELCSHYIVLFKLAHHVLTRKSVHEEPQYIGVLHAHRTMLSKKVCWGFVWSGNAKRLIITVSMQLARLAVWRKRGNEQIFLFLSELSGSATPKLSLALSARLCVRTYFRDFRGELKLPKA